MKDIRHARPRDNPGGADDSNGSGPVPHLLPLLYLASPALPVGGFAWSQGLAPACASGLVHDGRSLRDWLMTVLRFGLERLDVPVLSRCGAAAAQDDRNGFFRWDSLLLAGRESAELLREESMMGKALCRLLRKMGLLPSWMEGCDCGYVAAFALGAARLCARLGLDHRADETACAYVWSWLENQTVCACKCLPIGQSAVQQILLDFMPLIPASIRAAARVSDDDLGSCLPALAIVSSAHERQPSRMFRS
ncbi:MAG: urease accessory protein UreF [Desulfovibrio sp.]|nr:urease accessory protein UreF [Desulfovibrio sp.]